MKWLGATLFGASVLLLIGAALAALCALDPTQIERVFEQAPKPIAIKLPDSATANEPPPPPPQAKTESLASQLAPDTFSSSLPDLGAGVGFGGNGSGPSIAGGGGFGTDAGRLVSDRAASDRPARAIVRSPPEYPAEARNRSLTGYVVLRVYVGANGTVDQVEVEKSEPQGFFDQAAIKAVRSWKFEPAIANGQTVAKWITQKVKFELN